MTTVKPTMSISQIQNAITKSKKVRFAPGIYNITKELILDSGTQLYLDGAVLRRMMAHSIFRSKHDANTVGYKGAKSIKIYGGVLEAIDGYRISSMTSFFHVSGLRLEGVTFTNAPQHCIDIIGCENVKIVKCCFIGAALTEKLHKEAIQIDFAYYCGYPHFSRTAKCYDMTRCKNVIVSGCSFYASQSWPAHYVAIGTHTQALDDGKWHEKITVKNCFGLGPGVRDGKGQFIKLINMKEVKIYGNDVKGYGRFVGAVIPKECYKSTGEKIEGKSVHNVYDVHIWKNKFTPSEPHLKNPGIYIVDKKGDSGKIRVSGIDESLNSIKCRFNERGELV